MSLNLSAYSIVFGFSFLFSSQKVWKAFWVLLRPFCSLIKLLGIFLKKLKLYSKCYMFGFFLKIKKLNFVMNKVYDLILILKLICWIEYHGAWLLFKFHQFMSIMIAVYCFSQSRISYSKYHTFYLCKFWSTLYLLTMTNAANSYDLKTLFLTTLALFVNCF